MYNKLLNKDYLSTIAGNVISIIGSLLYSAAISYWIYQTTQSTVLMGAVSGIALFINVLLQPIAGSVIDHFKKRNILLMIDGIAGLAFISFGIITTKFALTTPIIFTLAIIETIDSAFCGSAASNILADILDKKILVKGSSISTSISYLARIIFNYFKGMLILIIPMNIVTIIYGGCYLIACLTHLFLSDYMVANNESLTLGNFVQDIKLAGKYCIQNSGLFKLLCIIVIANFFTTGLEYILVAFTSQNGMSVEQYGIITSVQAFGSFGGFVIVSQISINDNNRLKYCMGSFFIAEIFIAMAFFIGRFYLTSCLMFIGYLFNGIANGVLTGMLLSILPAKYRGVMYAFVNVASTLGMSLSSLTYGQLGDLILINYLGLFGHIIACITFGMCFAFDDVKQLFSQVD